jgi:serine/threonine protein kinase
VAVYEALQETDPPQVGPYRIEARLGLGGMGCVYLGRSRSGRAVAVKVVRPELAGDREFQRRFSREVAVARTVSGFFTAGVVDADPTGSPPWLVTAYVPGMSLAEAISEHGPWPERSVLALGAGLAEALSSIHEAGVVHRDLKPSNVLLATDGPRVIDFGISVALEGTMLTQTGQAVGTPGFMSPEQLTGAPVGPAGDVFCLGAMLMFTATGIGPFGTGQWQALAYRTVYEEPSLEALPPGLRAVVARCLVKQPEQRPPVTDLLDELADRANDAGMVGDVFTQALWLPESVAHVVRTRAAAPQPTFTTAGTTAVTEQPAPEVIPVRPPGADGTTRRPRSRGAQKPPGTGDHLRQHKLATAVIEEGDDAATRRASRHRAPRPAAIQRDRRASADLAEARTQSVEPSPEQLPAEDSADKMPRGVKVAQALLHVQAAALVLISVSVAKLTGSYADEAIGFVSLAVGLSFASLLVVLAARYSSRRRRVRTITRPVELLVCVIHLSTLLPVSAWYVSSGAAMALTGSVGFGLIAAATVFVGMSGKNSATWFSR